MVEADFPAIGVTENDDIYAFTAVLEVGRMEEWTNGRKGSRKKGKAGRKEEGNSGKQGERKAGKTEKAGRQEVKNEGRKVRRRREEE